MGHFFRQTRKANAGQTGVYLQAALFLLLTVGLVFVLMTVSACDCNGNGIDDCNEQDAVHARLVSSSKEQDVVSDRNFQARIIAAAGPARPGQRVRFELGGYVTGAAPAPTKVNYEWSPPHGASNFHFPGRQPEPGGPPFQFKDVPPGEKIEVYFNMANLPPGQSEALAMSFLDSYPDNGAHSTAIFETSIVSGLGALDLPAVLVKAAGLRQEEAASPDIAVVWGIHNWFAREITVTSDLCQQAVDVLRGPAAFAAIRLPAPTHAVTESYLLPLVTDPDPYFSSTIELLDYSGGLDVQGRLDYRQERFDFLSNELPAAPGEYWIALGLTPDEAITCTPGLTATNWEIATNLWLDLSTLPGRCDGCTLPVYFCYEGQQLPGPGRNERTALEKLAPQISGDDPLERAAAGQLARVLEGKAGPLERFSVEQLARLGGGAGLTTYQDWGITCIGPVSLLLETAPTWELAHSSVAWVTPTMAISFTHYIVTGSPMTLDYDYTSNLGNTWELYDEAGQPIVPPFTANGYMPFFVSGTVPAGTAHGLYTMVFTLTSTTEPTDLRRATNFIWVGDWIPPAPAPCGSLTGVTLSGPANGAPGVALEFLAAVAPPAATTPITYTWEAQGQTTVVHPYRYITDTAHFTWTTSGRYAVTVTASNCGAAVSDNFSMVVEREEVIIEPATGARLVYTDSQGLTTTVQVPPYAVTETTVLVFAPVALPTHPISAGLGFAQHGFTLEAYRDQNLLPGFVFAKPVTITIHYNNEDVLGIDESSLRLYYWAGSAWADAAGTCAPPSSYARDPVHNVLSVAICHLSEYDLLGLSQPTHKVYLPLVFKSY